MMTLDYCGRRLVKPNRRYSLCWSSSDSLRISFFRSEIVLFAFRSCLMSLHPEANMLSCSRASVGLVLAASLKGLQLPGSLIQ